MVSLIYNIWFNFINGTNFIRCAKHIHIINRKKNIINLLSNEKLTVENFQYPQTSAGDLLKNINVWTGLSLFWCSGEFEAVRNNGTKWSTKQKEKKVISGFEWIRFWTLRPPLSPPGKAGVSVDSISKRKVLWEMFFSS